MISLSTSRRCQCLALVALLALPAWCAAQAQPSPDIVRRTSQLLDWLGVLALVEQAPLAVASSIEAEAKFRRATPQQSAAWRQEIEADLSATALKQNLLRYVAQRYQPDLFSRAEALLEQPLARRVRYFELAMARPVAVTGLREFREELQRQPQPARRKLVQELDSAAATSALAAALQTYIGERVRQAAGAESTEPALLAAELAERQRYLQPFTEDYLLYAYRFLRDDELSAYRELLRNAQLQTLLAICQQGLVASLQSSP
jgi:hypothetical protein